METRSANAGFPLSSGDSDQRPDPLLRLKQRHTTGTPRKPPPPPVPKKPKMKPPAYEALPPKPPTYRTSKAPPPKLPDEESTDNLSAKTDRDAPGKPPAVIPTPAATSEELNGAQQNQPKAPVGIPALKGTKEDSTSKKIEALRLKPPTYRTNKAPPPKLPDESRDGLSAQSDRNAPRKPPAVIHTPAASSEELKGAQKNQPKPSVGIPALKGTEEDSKSKKIDSPKPQIRMICSQTELNPYSPPPQVSILEHQQQQQSIQADICKGVKRMVGVLQPKKQPPAASTTDMEVRIAQSGPKKPAEFPFSAEFDQDPFEADFISICKIIHDRLMLICEYYKKGTISKRELVATYQQLENKEVSISVFGRHNTGKSSLLNALAGGSFLPVMFKSETSFKVKVFHQKKVHQAPCQMVSQPYAQTEQTEPFCRHSKHAQCPQLCEVHHGNTGKVVYGEEHICSHLKELNYNVRKEFMAVDSLPEFELYVNVPVLGGIPEGWKVCLVDNPGFGEATQHITQLAERAMKISSAYIYLLTTKSIGDTVDAEAFKNLAERDREAFVDGRFVAVVTHFDENYGRMAGQLVEEGAVKEYVCEKISEATKTKDEQAFCIDDGSVVAISGLWALTARLMQKMGPNHPEYSKTFDHATQALKRYPHLDFPRGQGETLEDYLKQHPETVSGMLFNASGLRALQKKIEVMTKSCVTVWAKKMSSDYSTFIRDTKETLCTKQICVKEKKNANTKTYETDLALHTSIEDDIKALELPSNKKSSPVWQAINAAYPTDIETSDLHGIGERTIMTLVEGFKRDTKDKIKKRQLSHEIFNDSMSTFLKKASDHLDKTFNQTCAFTGAHEVLRKRSMELVRNIGTIRAKGNELLKCSSMKIKHETKESPLVTEGQIFEPPNLAEVKTIVKIPPVTLSLFTKFTLFVKNLFTSRHEQTYKEKLQADIEQKQATLQYRSWNKDHDEMMDLLQKSLEEQCKSYFEGIRPKIVKYFYKKYKKEVKQECKNLAPLKTQLHEKKEQIDQLHVEIERQGREMTALEETLEHMARLEAALKEKTDKYIHSPVVCPK